MSKFHLLLSLLAFLPATLSAQRFVWASSFTDTIRVADLGQAASDLSPELDVAPYGTSGGPWGVDVYQDQIYFTEDADQMLLRMNLDGSGVTILGSGATIGNARDLHVFNDTIYWVTWSGSIKSSNLAGGGVTELGNTGGFLQGIFVNAQFIYYTDATAKVVARRNLDGSGATTLVSGLNIPYGIWATDTRLVFADLGANRLYQSNLDGSGLSVLVDAFDIQKPSGVVVEGTRVYFTEQYSGLGQVNLDGSGLTRFLTGETDARFLDLVSVPEPAHWAGLLGILAWPILARHRKGRSAAGR